ncbi:DUF4282 domain-containing protein [Nocardia implantans]|uniref:DUF4282 domain-containing protein n=1 Tax=Nocardia implantans TaxID=3108168 RepID=A0ABU6ANK2_9NOCA|nr:MULTISPECIES: DUF4282 domain-containing protein [unclassified Nocardia]MBF6192203.1 DUF4282 domain-containing protein [Nocardia beijingensis]MEA3530954.1 DUF4282 domain-containing protein [Nocardia sp. CDC192]MEB3509044.1 DUF4282 domain-containing protein [Nocardia sp. CDC186]
MSDEPNETEAPEDVGEYQAESRWLTWKESMAARVSGPAPEEEQPAEPFGSPRAFAQWSAAAARALIDVQFHRPATRTLLPLAYILGLVFAFAVPITLTVSAWRVSALLGVLAAVLGVPLGLTIAAAVRLMLEFLVNASRLATRVEHISELADDLFQALSDVAEPVNQLSEDVRAVQFWRFRKRNQRR